MCFFALIFQLIVNMLILRKEFIMMVIGIETSCDETAAAVVSGGEVILSDVVWSQIATHHPYGGVVPELAARKHIEKIVPVFQEALTRADVGLDDLEAVAVTCGPGLVGALLVGLCFAKAIAYARGLPLIGVNHLEGHVAAVHLEPDPPPYPFVALLASGGHTNLYYVVGPTRLEHMGQTRDDAAGEAFDKVAKVLGLGYPGGHVIDELSKDGDPERIRFPRAFLDKTGFDFSFSGIKTAVARYVSAKQGDDSIDVADIAASFQEAVIDVLVKKAILAVETKRCEHLVVVGGVACNRRLRACIEKEAARVGISAYIPKPELCTDNGAMIATMGHRHLSEGKRSSMDLDAFSRDWRANT